MYTNKQKLKPTYFLRYCTRSADYLIKETMLAGLNSQLRCYVLIMPFLIKKIKATRNSNQPVLQPILSQMYDVEIFIN